MLFRSRQAAHLIGGLVPVDHFDSVAARSNIVGNQLAASRRTPIGEMRKDQFAARNRVFIFFRFMIAAASGPSNWFFQLYSVGLHTPSFSAKDCALSFRL